VSLLVDGARALARSGHWTPAAEAMTAHRGIGKRLLDGRQILIMSLMERGLDQQARDTIDATSPAEPWETAVAALLRIACRPESAPTPQPELDRVLHQILALTTRPDPTAVSFHTRLGLAALDLARGRTSPAAALLHDAVIDTAAHDAYAARDVLNHQPVRSRLTTEQTHRLDAVLTASALGAGTLSPPYARALTAAADKAEATLRELL
jgi:hypothetical protein